MELQNPGPPCLTQLAQVSKPRKSAIVNYQVRKGIFLLTFILVARLVDVDSARQH